jgi:hypothetical protein
MSYQTLLKFILQWGIAISLGASTTISNATEKDQGLVNSQTSKPPATRLPVIYKPPLVDDTLASANGSIRKTVGKSTTVLALAPDHTGLTTQQQPTLYWYTRTPMAVRFKLSMINEDGTQSLLEVKAGSEKTTGIQQLDLGKQNISLQPGVVYQWSVASLTDKGNHSADVSASGVIERIKMGEGLTSRIEKTQGIDLVTVYAYEGIWYDALETISSMIDKSPGDQSLVAIRASLLDQVGLQATTGD